MVVCPSSTCLLSTVKSSTAAEPVPDVHPEVKVARLYGVLYCFLAKAMLDTFRSEFRSEGERVLRQALRDYATHEAKTLNEDQLACGWEIHKSALRPVEGYSTATGQYLAFCI